MKNEGHTINNDYVLGDIALIQGIADAAPGMLYVIELQTMKMVYANEKVLKLFGKTLDELSQMGVKLFDKFVFYEDRERFDAHIKDLLESEPGEVKELTFRLLNFAGIPTWVRTRRTIYKTDSDGKPTHVISLSQDISREMELMELKAQLEEEKRILKEEKQLEIFRAILSTQEEERQRISESLHNGLGQLLYGAKLNLSTLNPQLAAANPESFSETKQYTSQLLDEGIKQTRRISHQLMPTVLNDFGIRAAIEDVCHKMEAKIMFSFDFEGLSLLKPKYLELAVYRTVQELVLNIGKHAKATHAKITLKVKPQLIHINVCDNGVGFDVNKEGYKGIGIRSIRDKISLLKGFMKVISTAGRTEIDINIPMYAK
jgi:PAS domain S-box-containing protein